jgi:hypothetical protein
MAEGRKWGEMPGRQARDKRQRGQLQRRSQRRELERQLAEGYRTNASLDRRICREFAHVDAEGL